MLKQFAISEQPPRKEKLKEPELFLSSAGQGWKGLEVEAFHEPLEIKDWVSGPPQDDILLVLLSQGSMLMERRPVRGSWKMLPMRREDLILSPPQGEQQEVRWRSLTPDYMQTVHIHLSQELIARTAEEVANRAPGQTTLVGRTCFQDPLLAQIGFALYRELELGAHTGKLYAETAAQMLAVHLLRHYTAPGIEIKELGQRLSSRHLKLVTDFALAHLSQDLPLEALAHQTGFSPYHFARLFRETTGESPHQFVLRLRVERARHLLQQTDMPLAHVALESGFANQSHLSRIFKQHLGLTPRAYRLEH
ncbi:helix-turn-helix domain-containing protein [Ktedonosporobacter rubrisoli]|uniref:Helix-turn-helix domain-containing protein n=1 Tax=Ktedonosporobacter rubrisoli TaxID=2509675 RepID=A0A4P6JV47_KTERU|nr:helix-turn-helix domain-containing protein [Ktedonosporobacter rubrisoli]QBD79529.1 helix-turn-helix domain-containing protein [Ktedonosporobacter rubrisoli]